MQNWRQRSDLRESYQHEAAWLLNRNFRSESGVSFSGQRSSETVVDQLNVTQHVFRREFTIRLKTEIDLKGDSEVNRSAWNAHPFGRDNKESPGVVSPARAEEIEDPCGWETRRAEYVVGVRGRCVSTLGEDRPRRRIFLGPRSRFRSARATFVARHEPHANATRALRGQRNTHPTMCMQKKKRRKMKITGNDNNNNVTSLIISQKCLFSVVTHTR